MSTEKKVLDDVEIPWRHSTIDIGSINEGANVQYMLLVYLDESRFEAMSQRERDGFINDMLDYDDSLRSSGHYVMSEALKPPRDAVTVRVWDGSTSVLDGPFMETKEHLSGLFLIEARDLNDAISAASRMPLATVGSIEVRPVHKLKRIET